MTSRASTDRSWMEAAACIGADTDAFFPEKSGDVGPAKALCARCGVREECLTYAMSTGQRCGVWGGMSAMERRALRAAMRRTG